MTSADVCRRSTVESPRRRSRHWASRNIGLSISCTSGGPSDALQNGQGVAEGTRAPSVAPQPHYDSLAQQTLPFHCASLVQPAHLPPCQACCQGTASLLATQRRQAFSHYLSLLSSISSARQLFTFQAGALTTLGLCLVCLLKATCQQDIHGLETCSLLWDKLNLLCMTPAWPTT